MKASRPSLDIYSLSKSSLLTLEPDVEVEEAEDVSDEVLLNKEELKRPKLSLPCDRPPCEARRAKANEYELLIRNMVRIRATNDLSEDISQRNRHVSHLVGSDTETSGSRTMPTHQHLGGSRPAKREESTTTCASRQP